MPRYLQNIKVGLAQQHAEKQAAKEAAMVPPGMRIMPEEERLEMLGILNESRQDVEAKLQVGFVRESPVHIQQAAVLHLDQWGHSPRHVVIFVCLAVT